MIAIHVLLFTINVILFVWNWVRHKENHLDAAINKVERARLRSITSSLCVQCFSTGKVVDGLGRIVPCPKCHGVRFQTKDFSRKD